MHRIMYRSKKIKTKRHPFTVCAHLHTEYPSLHPYTHTYIQIVLQNTHTHTHTHTYRERERKTESR